MKEKSGITFGIGVAKKRGDEKLKFDNTSTRRRGKGETEEKEESSYEKEKENKEKEEDPKNFIPFLFFSFSCSSCCFLLKRPDRQIPGSFHLEQLPFQSSGHLSLAEEAGKKKKQNNDVIIRNNNVIPFIRITGGASGSDLGCWAGKCC